MATSFKTQQLVLTSQQIRASGTNSMLYVNGIEVTAGISGNLTQTGVLIETQINSLSGWAASAVNLAATGSTLYNLIVNDSGLWVSTIATTGQQAWNAANNNGINLSGNLGATGSALYIDITGLSGVVNAISGALQGQIVGGAGTPVRITGSTNLSLANFTGAGNVSISLSGSTVFVSGNASAGGITQAQLDALSGVVGATGSVLYNLITGLSGVDVATYATIVNLALTGSNLYVALTGLSGQANANLATVTNLALTGSSLYVALTGESGTAVVRDALTSGFLLTGISNYSGFANQQFVHRTGAEVISGDKTFSGNHYVTSGNMGVGTNQVSARLHVLNNTGATARFERLLSQNTYLEVAASGVTGYWSVNGNRFFQVNNNTGFGDFLSAVLVDTAGTFAGTYSALRSYSGSSTPGDPKPYDLFFGIYTGNTGGYAYIYPIHESTANVPLILAPSFAFGGAGALVGIGTFAPSAKLDVNGTVNISGIVGIMSRVGINTANPVKSLTVISTGTNDGVTIIASGTLSPSYSFISGTQEMGALAMSLNPGHFSVFSNTGDVILRTSSNTGSNLFISNQSVKSGNIIFTIGPTPSDIEIMRITSGGNIGIGTATPSSLLNITGGVFVADHNLNSPVRHALHNVSTGSSAYTLLDFGNDISATQGNVGVLSSTNNSYAGPGSMYFGLVGNYNVGIVTSNVARVVVSGDGKIRFSAYGVGALNTDANGNITAVSDERLKYIIGPFTRGIESLTGIQPISHRYRPESSLDTSGLYHGFSAQNVMESIPEAVYSGVDGYLSFSDRPLIAALVNAVTQLNARVIHLESIISGQR